MNLIALVGIIHALKPIVDFHLLIPENVYQIALWFVDLDFFSVDLRRCVVLKCELPRN